MKTLMFYSVLIHFLVCSCQTKASSNNSETATETYSNIENSIDSKTMDTLLMNIQQKILDAFVQSRISRSDKELLNLETQLIQLDPTGINPLVTYWYAYSCYYHSIYFTIQNEDTKSESILFDGIKQLEKINQKNSEHFALLALMQSFSIKFAAGIQAPFISKKVKQNAQKSIEMDSINLRAYYVLGSNDFYTPVQYGGGKKVEEYLIHAIRLNNQSIENPYLPSWGKNLAYEMLIKFYIRNNEMDKAKLFYSEAHTLYPDDFMINKLANELIK